MKNFQKLRERAEEATHILGSDLQRHHVVLLEVFDLIKDYDEHHERLRKAVLTLATSEETMHANLTATQTRCTSLMLENQALHTEIRAGKVLNCQMAKYISTIRHADDCRCESCKSF